MVLITGGLWFVGSDLARELVKLGARVLMVNSILPCCEGDIHNIDDIEEEGR